MVVGGHHVKRVLVTILAEVFSTCPVLYGYAHPEEFVSKSLYGRGNYMVGFRLN
jgi:hypothetical protein